MISSTHTTPSPAPGRHAPAWPASLYVVGGRQRGARPLHAATRDWYHYERGVILRVEQPAAAGATVASCLEYVSPPEVCAPEEPAILFKSCTVRQGKLYACTQTEVLIYSLPGFTREHYISLPCFNDLHHVVPTPAGTLLVANSGLDMALELSLEGDVLHEWSALGEDPWTRFTRHLDYRRLSTKPHASHPNQIFLLDEEVWVTRFQQRDAYSLSRPGRRIAISIERPHDGHLHAGRLYFTTVDGHVVVVNPGSLAVEEIINLPAIHGDTLLGWCRGVLVHGDLAWVGFSRLRPTRFREHVSWAKNSFRREMPTHLSLYDLARRRCLATVEVEAHGLNAIFSIVPAEAG